MDQEELKDPPSLPLSDQGSPAHSPVEARARAPAGSPAPGISRTLAVGGAGGSKILGEDGGSVGGG